MIEGAWDFIKASTVPLFWTFIACICISITASSMMLIAYMGIAQCAMMRFEAQDSRGPYTWRD